VAGSSLLVLIDDIATVLDDVAILSKVAAKKTAGVLGDDLALNAEQVSGVKADRELPVVWAVAKGSFLNKLILVPAALLISAIYPPLITVLMILGGLFLCFEGAEKITHKLLSDHEKDKAEHRIKLENIADERVDLVALERNKIKGAIRTDFILSAEIIVIVLGSVKEAAFQTQIMVLSGLAIAFTIGVYGFVAAIVKLDDLGLYLLRKSVSGRFNALQRNLGRGLLIFAPKLMKTLTVVGTIAMFLVGGGILVHSFSWLHHKVEAVVHWSQSFGGSLTEFLMPLLIEGTIGLIAGLLLFIMIFSYSKIKAK
jgi:predicted DNA repair protein MutK